MTDTGEALIYLSAKEAAAELSVSLSTLYAYVSRDLIRSEPLPNSRAHRYRGDDVRRLKQRNRSVRAPLGDQISDAHSALNFGMPVLDSAITLIAGGKLYYRGVDVANLAPTASLEQIATLLWDCTDQQPFRDDNLPPRLPGFADALAGAQGSSVPTIERCLATLPVAATSDAGIYNKTERGLAATGARIMRLVAATLAGTQPSADPIHEVVARSFTLGDRQAADLIRAALVLCADHELNASAFTVRCVAGTGATLYGALTAGICAAQGPLHGGLADRVERLLVDLANGRDIEAGVLQRLRDNETLPGFDHPLYPSGDPRGAILLEMTAQAYKGDPAFERARRVADIMAEAGELAPNIDFALAALGAALRLPPGAGLSLFVLGRTAGWVGHAIEQYRSGHMIRPRARYVGETPK